MDEIQKSFLMSKISRIDSTVPARGPQKSEAIEKDFESFLGEELIQVSKHAEKRLADRNIELSDALKAKLSDAMGSLQQKGARDSLLLSDDHAFIVNVPSRTLVTALSKEQMREHIFTNIDSTMILK